MTQPDPGITDTLEPAQSPQAKQLAAAVLGDLGRGLATALRWALTALVISTGPPILIAWTVTPRVTDTSALTQQAAELGLTNPLRTELVERTAELVAGRVPVDEIDAAAVLDRGMSQEWLDEQLGMLSATIADWLAVGGEDLPELVVDLGAVKRSLSNDPELSQFAFDPTSCTGPGCTPPGELLQELIAGVPEELDLLADTADDPAPEELLDVRDRLRKIRNAIRIAPLFWLTALLAIVALAPKGKRLRWLAGPLAAVAIPLLALSVLVPGAVAAIPTGTFEAVLPFGFDSIGGLVSWATAPTRNLAIAMLTIAAVAFVASSVLAARDRLAAAADQAG